MNDFVWKSRANAKMNQDFISIETYSGHRLAFVDPSAKERLWPLNIANEILGSDLLEALAQSRRLSVEEAAILRMTATDRYEQHVVNLMKRYGYKTKQMLFKNMYSCGIESFGGIITIRPTHHEKLEGWSGDGIDKNSYVKIQADSSPNEVGDALRLAFSRCTG